MEAAKYEAAERLRDGRQVTIRALRPGDREGLLEAVANSSTRSLYRRFFSPKRKFTEAEIAFFLNVDFVEHLALVAIVHDEVRPTIVGGARCIVVQPGRAEVAFAIVDKYQGRGLGAALMQHLVHVARQAGIKELVAEVLADNSSMMAVFKRSGLPLSAKQENGVLHVVLKLI